MKRHYATYTPQWELGSMRYWVHRRIRESPNGPLTAYDKPLPRPVPGKGYPHYHVQVDGFTFECGSLEELNTCVGLLGRKQLPSTYALTQDTISGPGSHWLSKQPGGVKSWRYREKAMRYMRRAQRDFERGFEDLHR